MRKNSILLLAAVLTGAVACTVAEEEPVVLETAENTVAAADDDYSPFVPGEVIVELTEELTAKVSGAIADGAFLKTKSEDMNNAFAEMGVIAVKPLYEVGGRFEARQREAGLHRWFKITYDTEVPQTKATIDLQSIDGVLYVEPVRKIRSTAVFNDPGLPKQWHYINDGSMGGPFKAGCDINVQPVWENYTGGSSNVIVAVEDGGIDMEHEDLAAVVIPGGRDGSKNFVTGSYKISAHDHGTHVAGTIGAINNNGIGVAGIAGGLDGNGGVRLMSVQVFANGEDGNSLSGDFYNAMIWSADHGAVISQNSWGHEYKTAEEAKNGGAGSISTAIDYFIKNAGCDENGKQLPNSPMKGGVVIFAAGNDGWPDGWPAEYSAKEPHCISVGSVGPGFMRAAYSNYGDWVTIAAPGGDTQQGAFVYSTLPGNKYGNMQGTSMACPHVSGVAALIVSHFGGQGFTNDMLVERLVKGADPNALMKNSKIGPLVNAFGSFTYGGTIAPDPVTSYTAKGVSNNINFEWKVTGDKDDVKAFGYVLLASESKTDLTNPDLQNLPSSVSSSVVEVGNKKKGDAISGTITGLKFNTTYYVAIVGYDYNKNYSKLSSVNSTKTGVNNPPVISTDYTGGFTVKSHETLQVVYKISDPDGHDIKVKIDGGSAAARSEILPDGTYRLTITGKDDEPGRYTAQYDVTDIYGESASKKIEYEILENHAPEVRKSIDNMIFEQTAQKLAINMDDYITDPDGEPLVYSLNISDKAVVHINQVDNLLNLTTLDYGLANIVVTAADARGKTCELSFKVLVRDPAADPDIILDKSGILTVHDGTMKSLEVTVVNAGGAVLDSIKANGDAFNPISVDMSSYAPGRYGVTVVSEGKTTYKTIVKP